VATLPAEAKILKPLKDLPGENKTLKALKLWMG